ncbi:MAG: recombination protein RecR [Candidatus Eisenbacteria sp.]|nr:recombination protein RecR [Candidatus Eisenbacteria bacterium]
MAVAKSIYGVGTVASLVERLAKLPGIGRKSAQRVALHLLRKPEEADALSAAIRMLREKVGYCRICGDLAEEDLCPLCSNESRNVGTICVVEGIGDVMALESTGAHRGRYHVLHGLLSPLDGIGPGDIRIRQLLDRLEPEAVTELILATPPNVEGDATAAYVAEQVRPRGVKTTRIARGLPVGSDVESADQATLSRALEGRTDLK